jgi:hypothetical protein
MKPIFFSWCDPSFPVKAQLQLAASGGFFPSLRTGVESVIGQDWKKLRIFLLRFFPVMPELVPGKTFSDVSGKSLMAATARMGRRR